TWLLVSNGQFGMLRLSFGGLSWGITSAIALAFYTLYPGSLLREWGSTRIVGWGMIGGAILSEAVAPVWSPNAPWWSLSDILLIAFVVLLGTLAAFWLYLASLRNISPAIASVVASAEPLVATAGSVLWLGVTLRGFQDLGAVSIIAAVLLLAWRSRRVEESPQ
ncbi:MAG: EamA family transporter, partial [Sulfobacillus thermosulfidooxidans]